jgi:hypothetical protein
MQSTDVSLSCSLLLSLSHGHLSPRPYAALWLIESNQATAHAQGPRPRSRPTAATAATHTSAASHRITPHLVSFSSHSYLFPPSLAQISRTELNDYTLQAYRFHPHCTNIQTTSLHSSLLNSNRRDFVKTSRNLATLQPGRLRLDRRSAAPRTGRNYSTSLGAVTQGRAAGDGEEEQRTERAATERVEWSAPSKVTDGLVHIYWGEICA